MWVRPPVIASDPSKGSPPSCAESCPGGVSGAAPLPLSVASTICPRYCDGHAGVPIWIVDRHRMGHTTLRADTPCIRHVASSSDPSAGSRLRCGRRGHAEERNSNGHCGTENHPGDESPSRPRAHVTSLTQYLTGQGVRKRVTAVTAAAMPAPPPRRCARRVPRPRGTPLPSGRAIPARSHSIDRLLRRRIQAALLSNTVPRSRIAPRDSAG
jgi:hypothetical protein